MCYSGSYSVLQWELQYVTVGVTVCYSDSYSVLQWELLCVTVGVTLCYSGSYSMLQWCVEVWSVLFIKGFNLETRV